MRPDDCPTGSPSDWLRHSRSDFELGRFPRPNVLAESLCFHLQQAVEKAVKGVLVSRAVEFPKTHNIRVLLDLLPQGIPHVPDAAGMSRLTDYAVTTRYPGDFEPVTAREHRAAIRLAKHVLEWAESILEGRACARAKRPQRRKPRRQSRSTERVRRQYKHRS